MVVVLQEKRIKIGMLTILEEFREEGRIFCKCLCDCGTVKTIRKDKIKIGCTISCGCYGRSQRLKSITKHGLSGSRIYTIWQDMRQRCCNQKNTSYIYYGAKGICVCQEWDYSPVAFYEWAIRSGYSDDLTLDRIDPEKDYCPTNCRWITQAENTTRAHLGKKHIRRSTTYGSRCKSRNINRKAHP